MYEISIFLTSTLLGGGCSVSRPAALPQRKDPNVYLIGGGVGPITSLDDVEEGGFLTA